MATKYITSHGRRIEVETLPSRVVPKRQRADRYIGCPVEWLKRVLPLVNTKGQLAVAIWLHRRQAVCGSKLFTVPNDALRKDLGLSRDVKYAVLKHLEAAKVITVARNGRHILQVRLL